MHNEIYMMYDTIPIAMCRDRTKFENFKALDDVPDSILPFGLFINRECTVARLTDWLSYRIFPKERPSCAELLKSLGLREYSVWGIVKKTKGSTMTDPYWLKFEDSDSFRESTVRGLFGLPAASSDFTYPSN